MYEVHGTSAPVFATVNNWINTFKHGWTSTKDEQCSGHPMEMTIPGMIDKIHAMFLSDWSINQSVWNVCGKRIVTRFHVALKIRCEENFGKMSVAFALSEE